MTLNLNFQDLKQIALHRRVVKNGITLIVGRPLIPDVKTDETGNAGEVRFTVDETERRPRGPWLMKPSQVRDARKPSQGTLMNVTARTTRAFTLECPGALADRELFHVNGQASTL